MKIIRTVILTFLLVLLVFVWVTIANSDDITKYKVVSGFDIKKYEIVNFDASKGLVDIAIEPTSNAVECGILEDKNKVKFKKIDKNKCIITNSLEASKVYFKDRNNHISKEFKIDNFILSFDIKDKYYLPYNSTIDLLANVVKVGNPVITINSSDPSVEIIDNKIVTKGEGKSSVDIYSNGELVKQVSVISTDVLIPKADMFDLNKPYISCKEYNGEKSKLIDEILNYRINEVGVNTRAAAVEAARFITMEFPRRIPYYWENGRLYKTGNHWVDGEGRYYHKGMYLGEDKYSDIEATMQGPQMWGCKMINWQDDPPDFVRNEYYPNGLDCSGFVSWVLLNGGFDIGDKGAGPMAGAYDLTDLGEFKRITNALISSNEIKVGDLFSTQGHISILIGMDEDYYYIAESLNHYGGVVMRKYTKTRVTNFFQNVVLMDNVYKNDGKLTNMWY